MISLSTHGAHMHIAHGKIYLSETEATVTVANLCEGTEREEL